MLAGLLLIAAGRGTRLRLGLERMVTLDNVTLTSRRLGFRGQPDRLTCAVEEIISYELRLC